MVERYHRYIEREAEESRREDAARLAERVLPRSTQFDVVLAEAREACENESEVAGFLAARIVGLESKLQALRESLASRWLS